MTVLLNLELTVVFLNLIRPVWISVLIILCYMLLDSYCVSVSLVLQLFSAGRPDASCDPLVQCES